MAICSAQNIESPTASCISSWWSQNAPPWESQHEFTMFRWFSTRQPTKGLSNKGDQSQGKATRIEWCWLQDCLSWALSSSINCCCRLAKAKSQRSHVFSSCLSSGDVSKHQHDSERVIHNDSRPPNCAVIRLETAEDAEVDWQWWWDIRIQYTGPAAKWCLSVTLWLSRVASLDACLFASAVECKTVKENKRSSRLCTQNASKISRGPKHSKATQIVSLSLLALNESSNNI